MSYIVAGRLDDLPSDIRHHLGTFRHKVFIQRLNWEIPGVSHDATSEWDKFEVSGGGFRVVATRSGDNISGTPAQLSVDDNMQFQSSE